MKMSELKDVSAEELITDIKSILLDKREVKVPQLGRFRLVKHKGRSALNSFGKGIIEVKPFWNVKFIPHESLKRRVKLLR